MTVGTLFTEDFLAEGIDQSGAWVDLAVDEVAPLRAAIAGVFASVANSASLNEAQTQHRIMEPILALLGWNGTLSVQTNIERKRRPDVSDYSFFPVAFAKADRVEHHDAKLKHAVAVGDAKQWSIGLDQSRGGAGTGETPSAQIIRYLTRAETVSAGDTEAVAPEATLLRQSARTPVQ